MNQARNRSYINKHELIFKQRNPIHKPTKIFKVKKSKIKHKPTLQDYLEDKYDN